MARKYGKRRRKYRKYKRFYRKKSYLYRKIYRAIDKRTETKYIDYDFDSPAVGLQFGTYYIARITLTGQGTGDSALRIGDQILVKKLQLRYNAVVADQYNRVRVTIIRWNEDDAFVAPSAAQVYQNPNDTIHAWFNWDSLHAKKFTIIHDKILDLETSNNEQIYVRKVIPINKKIRYNGGTGNGTGHLYHIIWGDSQVAPGPGIEFNTRVTFKDA